MLAGEFNLQRLKTTIHMRHRARPGDGCGDDGLMEQPGQSNGGWLCADSFGFKMAFHVVLEKATIAFDITQSPAIKVHPTDGQAFTPDLPQGDGYSLEISHFINCITGKKVPAILTPQQSLDSVRLVEAEKKSAQTGNPVKFS